MYNFSYLVTENLSFGSDICQSFSKDQKIKLHLMKHIRHRVPILSDKYHLSIPVSSVILHTHRHSPAY